jgi:hypothetical protein
MSFSTYSPLAPYSSEAPSQVFWGGQNEFRSSADDIPALASTLVQLELLLKPQTADLEAVTRLVSSDLGLTFQALRHARAEALESEFWRISDCVIHLGPKLLGVARPLCYRTDDRKYSYSEVEAFWKHAHLVATVAEKTATYFYELNVNPEQAYLAGLMHNLRQLPRVLDLVGITGPNGDLCNFSELALDWNLPSFIVGVLDRKDLAVREMDELSRMVSFARSWIDFCLPWSETCVARKTRFHLPVLQVANLICEYFPNTAIDPFAPFLEILKHSTLDNLDEDPPESSLMPARRATASRTGASVNRQRFRRTVSSRSTHSVKQV